MKKLLLILILVLTLELSGCDDDTKEVDAAYGYTECFRTLEGGQFKGGFTYTCDGVELTSEEYIELRTYTGTYYTQAEVDVIEFDLREEINNLTNRVERNEAEIRTLYNYLEEYFVWYEEENGNLYTQCQDASGWEECYIELNYQTQIDELKQSIEELEVIIEELEEPAQISEWVEYNEYFAYRIISEDEFDIIFGDGIDGRIDFKLERQDDGDFYVTFIGYLIIDSYPIYEESYEIYDSTHFQGTSISFIEDIIEDSDWEYLIDNGILDVWEEVKENYSGQ